MRCPKYAKLLGFPFNLWTAQKKNVIIRHKKEREAKSQNEKKAKKRKKVLDTAFRLCYNYRVIWQ